MLCDHSLVSLLFNDIAPRFAKRSGGYTRILSLGLRRGDSAEVVLLELTEIKKKESKSPKKAKHIDEHGAKLAAGAAIAEEAQGQPEAQEKHKQEEHVKEKPPVTRKPPKKFLGGIKNMERLPDAVFVIDPKKEKIAVHEANVLGIPVIAIVDTNCDPDPINFVIPGNDDAIRAIKLFSNRVAECVLEGQELQQKRITSKEEGDNDSIGKPIKGFTPDEFRKQAEEETQFDEEGGEE